MSVQSAETKDLAAALARAQAEIGGAVKDSSNPFFKSKYADLQSVWDACRAPLAKNGLSITQTTDFVGEKLVLVTTLYHSSGQWVRGVLPVIPIKNDPQGLGSALTYNRRYALAAMVGVYQTDDDGETAMGRTGLGGIHPQQPAPGDGTSRPEGTYRIPGHIGNPALAGRHPEDADPVLMRAKIDELEKKYDGKITPAGVVRFIKECEPFIAQWENQKL